MAAGPVERVRVGIVGGGRIADLNKVGWLEHARAEIVAVCDVNQATREARVAEWGCRGYADLDEMLADPDVDAVDILTPHHLHAPQAIAAFEAGKHVSIQKPPTRTLEEFDRVAAAAAKAGTVFKAYENFMFYPPHVLARKIIDEGGIGDVLSVRIVSAAGRMFAGQGWDIPPESNAWRLDPELCGGGWMTFDHGFHTFQMGRMFVDEPVERVHSFINFVDLGGGRQIDAPAHISWQYGGRPPRYGSWDLVTSLDLDVLADYYVSDDRIELRGDSGIIWVNQCAGRLLDEPPLVHYRDGVVRSYHRLETDWAASFRDATFDFIDAVLEERPPRLDAAEGRRTLVFSLAAQRSALEHREVALSEFPPPPA
jgi:predicted dehydrogenase